MLSFIETLDDSTKQRFMRVQHLDIRCTEYYIADDDPLFVLGSAEPIEGATSDVLAETLMLRKGDLDKTMYISNTGERRVIDKLSGGMYLSIFGGLVLSAICLFIMLAGLGV